MAKTGAIKPLQWQPLYEPGGGGAITGVAVDPHDSQHLVSLGDMLGVATSFDGGDLWQATFGFTSYEFSGGTTFHPTDRNTIWVASATGPYKSTDRGINWVSKRRGMPELNAGRYTAIVEKILYDPNQPRRLLTFGGTSRNWNEADNFGWIWESTDDGENWRHIGTITDAGFTTEAKKGANIHQIQYEPGSNSRLHLRTGSSLWFISDDDGRTWAQHKPQGLPTGVSSINFNPNNAQIVWATTHSYTTGEGDSTREPGGIYRSADGGKTFTQSDSGIKKVNSKGQWSLTSHFNNVVVSQSNPDILFTNDAAWNSSVIYKSVDGGANWKPVASREGIGVTHETADQKVFNPKTATFSGISMTGVADPKSADRNYWYNSEFILRTRDGGATWDDATAYRPDPKKPDQWRGRGWVGWCASNFAWNPYRRGQAVAQAMDAGRAWISDDDAQSWRYVKGEAHPWSGGQDVTFSRDGHIYVSTGQFGENNGLWRSRDWGKTWTMLSGAKHGLPEAGWGKPPSYSGIYTHPDKSNLVWAIAGDRILRSSNGGDNWSALANTPVGAQYIAPDPTRAGRFYVSAKVGVFVTEDGKTFSNIGGPRQDLSGRINCDSLGRVLMCQWRYGRTGVWRYSPGTKSWQRLLDENLAYECVADPANPRRLLMVTNMDPFNDLAGGNGVWLSADDGKSWSRQDLGLAMLRGRAVAFNPHNSEQIVMGTFGRGFFQTRWPKNLVPKATRTYRSTSEDSSTAQPEDETNLARNGAMNAGGALPANWDGKFGDATAARDSTVVKEGAASLRVDGQAGKSGQAFQTLDFGGGKTYTVSGWLKSKGDAKVNFAIQSFAGDWSKNDFKQVGYLQGDIDWTRFSKEVTIPDWAGRFNIVLMVEGAGQGWLDDVRVSQGAATTVAATTPIATKTPAATAKTPATKTVATTATAIKTAATPAMSTHAAAEITYAIRDFGPSGFDYAYGDIWKVGENISTGDAAGTGFAQLDTTEHGGAGVVLNGANIVPQKQTHLALRARFLPGNKAGALNVNINRDEANGGGKTIAFDISKLNEKDFTTISEPLGEGKFDNVLQVQVQGTNWSAGAQPLKLQIDSLGTTSVDEKANAAAKIAAAGDPSSNPAPKGKPEEAGWGFYPNFPQAWMNTHNGFLNRTKEGRAKKDINVVFLGDSITQGWGGDGKDIWEKNYAPLGAVNYGIGGDTTRQVLWRIQNGEIEGISPKLVVLKIGTNNLYGDNNSGSDEEIAQGIAKVVQTLRSKLPQTRVLLLGVLPRQNDWFSGRAKNINAIIAKLDDGKNARFLDMSAKYQTDLGKVVPDLYTGDQLHLAKPGYQLWADTMKPLFDQMMK